MRIATVFSGIGAIEQAFLLSKIPHKIVFACDSDKYVKESYFANYDIQESQWYNDIKNIDGTKYANKVDLFVGGSPCQSFSVAGNRLGFNDTRGTLFYEFARLVKEIQPSIFIWENVRGVTIHEKGKTFATIKNVFTELGYYFSYQLLNAKDFGIPQSRKRIFVVGFKHKHAHNFFKFPSKQHSNTRMKDILEDGNLEKYIIKNQNTTVFAHFHPKKQLNFYELCGFIKSIGQFGKFESNNIYSIESIAPTLMTHRGCNVIIRYQKQESTITRYCSPRECLRLMGFPDSFKIVVSDTQVYRQAGNSIVVNVLVALIKQIDFFILTKE